MSNNEKHHANWAEWAINHRQLVYFFAIRAPVSALLR